MDKQDINTISEQNNQDGGDMGGQAAATSSSLTGALNKTPIGLNQWVLEDKPTMNDFNEDNRIIDEAITDLREDLKEALDQGSGGVTPEMLANHNVDSNAHPGVVRSVNGMGPNASGNVTVSASETIPVHDNLSSTSATAALSANQGRVLQNSKADAGQPRSTVANRVLRTGAANSVASWGQVQANDIADNAVTERNIANVASLSGGSVIIGANAGRSSTGRDNTIVGSDAGYNNTTGPFNTFTGASSGRSNTTGFFNTFTGANAGWSNTTGANNTFTGMNAGWSNTTGSHNTFFGNSAGQANITGSFLTFVGDNAGAANSSGSANTFISAGNSNTSGSHNVFMGGAAGMNNTTGNRNTFVGVNAGRANATSSDSTIIGQNAGFNNIASGITFIGNNAGLNNTSGNHNVFMGNSAGRGNTTGSGNVYIGGNCAHSSTTGGLNTFVGENAGWSNTAGSSNTFIGMNAGSNNTSGNNATCIGSGSQKSNATASSQINLGDRQITQLRCNVTAITSMSDERTKEYHELADTKRCLDAVMNLPLSRYKYKDFTGTHIDEHRLGWMADDMLKVFPKSVIIEDCDFQELDENGEAIFEDEVREYEEQCPMVDDEGSPVLNEDGHPTYETVAKTETCKKPKMFTIPDCKVIVPEMMVPALWGAVQELTTMIKDLQTEVAELKESGKNQKKKGNGQR